MLTDLRLRLRSLFQRNALERDLDDELRFHLDQLIEAYRKQGHEPDEAARLARLEFGGLDQIRDEHRDARGLGPLVDFGRDIQHALRQLKRAPGFAALSMLCLGLGIGVNTSMFGVISAVLLRPLPVVDPDRLVTVARDERTPWSYPVFRDAQRHARTLTGLTAAIPMESDLDIDGDSSFVVAEAVSASYGDVIGIKPVLGRWLADDQERAAVISATVWERRFHRDPEVIGRLIRSQSESFTIVGVAPFGYAGALAPLRTDIWVPIRARPRLAAQLEEGGLQSMLKLFGRLRDGATAAQASAELNAIEVQLMAGYGATSDPRSPIVAEPVRSLPDLAMRRRLASLATLLVAVVGLVLVIASVNVGNLLLIRGAMRRREFEVRRALGASRLRLLRQLGAESLVIALGGSLVGVVLAFWTNRLVGTSVPPFLGVFEVQLSPSLDWRAIVFASVAALVATVLCGLLPAWRTSAGTGATAFTGAIGGGAPRRKPLGLVAQVVTSLVLLFVAGSTLQALQRLHSADPGFDVAGRLYAYVSMSSPTLTPDRRRELYSLAAERLRALPGVRAVSVTSLLPLMPAGSDCASRFAGPEVAVTSSGISPGYFDVMGIPLMTGRDFSSDDRVTDGGGVILSASLARRLLPDRPAVGETITIGCSSPTTAIVVGVAADSAIRDLGDVPFQPHVYRPIAAGELESLTAVVLDAHSDPLAIAAPVRRTLLDLGQGIRVYATQPLSAHVEQRYAPFRWLSRILVGFGLLALALAGIGLYGVIAYRVARRTREIGVRMALGASRSDISREVLRQGLTIVIAGVAIGELLTAAVTRLMASVLEGVGATGPFTHIGVALIWLAVALCACYVPAARAARVDPMVALRHE